uniref:Uncharacterized protein n=1 Tax=Pristionchus pacificus TaxID=54126 RepID=A0A2A6B544_PRIPA|eukprot:PDM60994.1 hypothetical protein PRIPAC_54800 [Pristionchus pacificus]
MKEKMMFVEDSKQETNASNEQFAMMIEKEREKRQECHQERMIESASNGLSSFLMLSATP